LETDVDEDELTTFNSFKSTQFFVTEFERSGALLSQETAEEVTDESWFESDSGIGIANWIVITICSLIVFFCILAVFICVQMRRNKSERNL